MSDNELPGPLKLGSLVFARRLGKADVRGRITWSGPSKWGDGFRYKVQAEDGVSHWADEKDLTLEAEAPGADPDAIRKGTRVKVTGGPHAGIEGDVYIVGPASRFGIRDDDEETYWVDGKDLEHA
jgi:hypothetical protein